MNVIKRAKQVCLRTKECQVYQFVLGTCTFKTICERAFDNSPTDSSFSFLKWWSAKQGLEALNNRSVFMFASSQYLSTHFWPCPSGRVLLRPILFGPSSTQAKFDSGQVVFGARRAGDPQGGGLKGGSPNGGEPKISTQEQTKRGRGKLQAQYSRHLVGERRWPKRWSVVKSKSFDHKRTFFSGQTPFVHFWRQRSCDQDDHQRKKSDDETRV